MQMAQLGKNIQDKSTQGVQTSTNVYNNNQMESRQSELL